MQRKKLEDRLKKGGWILKSGGKHNYVENPNRPGVKIIESGSAGFSNIINTGRRPGAAHSGGTVPRGSKINDTTAKGILKDAGLL
jgi:hypothetical protein